MAFVIARRWDNHRSTWISGKVHWMRYPWITSCGLVVGRDWLPSARWPIPSDPGVCKKCVPPAEEPDGD